MSTSTHPFLVDQRPYLQRTTSASSDSASFITTSSRSSNYHSTGSSSASYSSSSSSSSMRSNTSEPNYTSHSRPDSEIDITCLRFMRDTSDSEHYFGSISSRSSTLSREERALRRELTELQRRQEEQPPVEEKKKKRFGGLF